MPQITGKAVIRVDGEEWRTEDGAKLNPGGVTREAKVGGGKDQGTGTGVCRLSHPGYGPDGHQCHQGRHRGL